MVLEWLEKYGFDEINEAFSKAFADYAVQISSDDLKRMLKRRGFNPKLSFGAVENDKIVSFTLNGIGNFNGLSTAYDTGTGTIPEFRGQGLASKIFEYSVPFLKEEGIQQYLLEVLQTNKTAISVYQKQGFEISREFNYFLQNSDQVKIPKKELAKDFQIKSIKLPTNINEAEFYDFSPSWQNNFDSVLRKPEDFIIKGAFYNEKLIGFVIFAPDTGDITQIAVHEKHRRKGIGTNLLKSVISKNKHQNIKCLNIAVNCDSIKRFLSTFSIELKGSQFEMIKKL